MNHERLNDENIRNAILGGLRYLTDTFVFDSKNYRVHANNFTVSGNYKNNAAIKFFSSFREKTGRFVVKEKHLKNNWPGFINYTPGLLKSPLKSAFLVTDYNLFTTLSTAMPLFLFDDSNLEPEKRIITQMLHRVNETSELNKRNESYCFWPVNLNGKKPGIIGPVNIPGFIIDLRWNLNQITGFMGLQKFRESDTLFRWLEKCYNKTENETGSSALFNIPNDVDNTSTAYIYKHFLKKRYPEVQNPSPAGLDVFQLFIDKNRGKTDRHNAKIGSESGAFMTWLKDENLPLFKNPENGIIPLEANNVDIVINANALLALLLSGKQSMDGFKQAAELMVKCIKNDCWANASLYYPNKLQFSYSLSRAWCEGAIIIPGMEEAMQKMSVSLITEQQIFEKLNPGFKGAFPCAGDGNYAYSTTLYLITLLNSGKKIAEKAGMANEYDESVKGAVNFIVRNKIKSRVLNRHHPEFPGKIDPVYWNSGVLYSSSIQDLAEWRSDSQFTSLVMEALAKYVLFFDLEPGKYLSKKICLHNEKNNFRLTVSAC